MKDLFQVLPCVPGSGILRFEKVYMKVFPFSLKDVSNSLSE